MRISSLKESARRFVARPAKAFAFGIGFASLVSTSAVMAQATCVPDPLDPARGWQVNTALDSSDLKVGDVLASADVQVRYTGTFSRTFTLQLGGGISRGAPVVAVPNRGAGNSPDLKAVPLNNIPGVGLAIVWQDVWGGRAPINSWNYGGYITIMNGWTFEVSNAAQGWDLFTEVALAPRDGYTYANGWRYTQGYRYVLVVTNPARYEGGSFSGFQLQGGATFWASGAMKEAPSITCGRRDLIADLNTTLPTIPPLPPPVAPTCTFDQATLNQTVPMDSASPSRIAVQGSSREAGAEGQAAFRLNAVCPKPKAFNLYFTDVANPAENAAPFIKQAAGASKETVGLRLFHDQDTNPLSFGVAPTGSTIPTRAPLAFNSTQDNQAFSIPLTAQYVRLPGVTSAAPISSGPFQARSTVTVVYP
ncbi:fimbrial protein [Variovorax sp. J22P168]|uniref:fimbrial protein n=1 Tax=Variovorax jilinensis TaxID=3053513 RepID=UPI002576885A|nr:fimbrial protein [Variovorax sp. J22P168]MDM0011938.1 fimbrial protein [Variovorax sp. J22P168]